MKKLSLLLAIICSVILVDSCDKGIEPEPENSSGPTGFSGNVTFIGDWPADVKRTHLVVFKNPILTSEDFFPPNLAFVIDSIPYRSSYFEYNSVDNNFIDVFQLAPGEFSYVVVAQSSTPELSLDRKDWVVVGIYCENGNQANPAKLILRGGQMTRDVNIVVDFNNPPPQPPM